MGKNDTIQYLYDETFDMELVICDHSDLSYPTHNHVSVVTIGMVLNGSIILTTANHRHICHANQTFTILPYTPHCIQAHTCYTLLTLCIKKQVFKSSNLSPLKATVMNLLRNAPGSCNLSQEPTAKLLNCIDLLKIPLPLKRNFYIDNLRKQIE